MDGSSSNSGAAAAELLREGLRCDRAGLLDRALRLYREARVGQADPEVLADAWRLEAFVHHSRSAWEEALWASRRSAEIARAAGLDDRVAEALNAEAAVHLGRGDVDRAASLFKEMLELTGRPRIRGLAFQNLSIVHAQRGELEAAERRLGEAYAEFERAGYRSGQAHVLNNRVALALDRARFDEAEAVGWQALALAQRENDLNLVAIARLNLAEALLELGRNEEAQREASTALGQFEVEENVWRRVACLRILGDATHAEGDAHTARLSWQRGLDLAREIGASRDAAQLEARLRERLDPPPET